MNFLHHPGNHWDICHDIRVYPAKIVIRSDYITRSSSMKHRLLTILFVTVLCCVPSSHARSGAVPGTTILFFGDSITAGYGLDLEQAFPAIIEDIADADGYNVEAVNAGVSGETSAGGVRRIDWVLQRPFDIFVLELGGNDALRGVEPENTKENLQRIIDKVSENRPESVIVLAGMEAPPNMGEDYILEFRQVFRDLAENNEVIFIPFILEGVAGEPDLNQADGVHPTAEGHRIIASHVWPYLEPLL